MDSTVNKLTLLYIFEQMDFSATLDTLNDICCGRNSWLSYMTLAEILPELVDARFLSFNDASPDNNTRYYKITQDGRDCLKYFYSKIPSSLRNDISNFIRQNRQTYKRNQEYFRDYKKNIDGTYTLLLKVIEPDESKLEIKLNVDTHSEAVNAFNKWVGSASKVYSEIYKILIEAE